MYIYIYIFICIYISKCIGVGIKAAREGWCLQRGAFRTLRRRPPSLHRSSHLARHDDSLGEFLD